MDPATETTTMSAFEHYQAVVQHHKTLKQILERLPSKPDAGGDFSVLVTAAQRELDHAAASMPPLLKQIPAAERASPATAIIADKVFNIQELFEHILCDLDICDLLKAQQVSHHFFDTIQSSKKLQRHMGLAPDTKRDFRFLLQHNIFGIAFMTDAQLVATRLSEGDKIIVRAETYGEIPMPKLGERSRCILICQPPVKTMTAYAGCCSNRYGIYYAQLLSSLPAPAGGSAAATVITSDTGITLGDIIDAGQAVQRQHCTCPHAREYHHDVQGNVELSVTFEGCLSLAAKDKTLLSRRKADKAVKRERRLEKKKHARLAPYEAAKLAAEASEERIPTLEEFEAAQGS
ncbi:hypothetical protein LTR36_008892 [Oleoguttula mirabilis]|uniref:F-box domain-containing protein n=1 Tax=Oleoguttula mirabilis TaxID=1507867 RepID=A0AAV9J772_9PEZI|nr:hypothetical protein LTR36_008892 [Oleoguttula mirabilis]